MSRRWKDHGRLTAAKHRSILSAIFATVALSALFSTPNTAAAQELQLRDRVAFDVLLGREGLGLGVEYQILDRVALIARAEGWPFEVFTGTAAGLRYDPIVADNIRYYGAGLIGLTACSEGPLHGRRSCLDGDRHAAVAGLAGMEILLGVSRRWSAGIEGGYWYALDRDIAADDLDRWTFAAIVRWRPFSPAAAAARR